MCDFKPGDEVVLFRAIDYAPNVAASVTVGSTYTVRAVVPGVRHGAEVPGLVVIELEEADWGGFGGMRGAYRPQYFRKVQRRDLSAWLKTSIGNTDKLDKRQTRKVPA